MRLKDLHQIAIDENSIEKGHKLYNDRLYEFRRGLYSRTKDVEKWEDLKGIR